MEGLAIPVFCNGAEGPGVGTTKHPKAEGEEMYEVAGVGVTVDMAFGRVKLRSEAEGGGVDIEMDKKAMYAYAVLGSRVGRHAGRSKNPAAAAGGGKKRKKLVRFSKEYIEMKMREPRPVPHRRMSDELLDLLGNPARRAQEDELTAEAQKAIDRDAEMRRQYAIQGYADIELTDEEYDDEDRIDWRPWAYLKAAGLVDDYGQRVA
ncbi:unnamed protein product [Urochloa humidicola]